MHCIKMYLCKMYSKELIKGTLQPIILTLIHSRGKMYGYEITQEVKKMTSGKIDISEGALYPILHKLEAKKMLQTEKVFHGKRVRRYYNTTPEGKKMVAIVRQQMNDFIGTLDLIFNPKTI